MACLTHDRTKRLLETLIQSENLSYILSIVIIIIIYLPTVSILNSKKVFQLKKPWKYMWIGPWQVLQPGIRIWGFRLRFWVHEVGGAWGTRYHGRAENPWIWPEGHTCSHTHPMLENPNWGLGSLPGFQGMRLMVNILISGVQDSYKKFGRGSITWTWTLSLWSMPQSSGLGERQCPGLIMFLSGFQSNLIWKGEHNLFKIVSKK